VNDSQSARVRRAKRYFSDENYHIENYMSVRRAEIVRELVAGTIKGARVLDLGSGSGIVSVPLLPDCSHLTLVDYSPAALDIARSRIGPKLMKKVDLKVGDILNFQGEKPYDLVLCIGVLAHVDSTEEALRAVTRNLASGGQCIVQMTPPENPLTWLSRGTELIRNLRYRRTPTREVMETAERLGLRFVRKRRHFLVVPGARRFLGKHLLAYDRWVTNSPLARFGTSDLILFRKVA
jgi:2-polyprenyl-3-methyl-5-hydroxy-6-metoxy-1,4-benzoquinol methylase